MAAYDSILSGGATMTRLAAGRYPAERLAEPDLAAPKVSSLRWEAWPVTR